MKTWNLLPTLSASMPVQLAMDETLFRRLENAPGVPYFRFYFSSEPWISLGYSADDKNLNKICGVPVCKRITGGGSVYHGNDLIFSLVAKSHDDESFHSVRMSYLKIHEAVKLALEELNERPRFYRCDEKLAHGTDCFRYPIATDLAIGNRKVAGGAQKRSAGTLLHQESIQLSPDRNSGRLMQALRSGFEQRFEIKFERMRLDPELLIEAKKLANDKYADISYSDCAAVAGSMVTSLAS